MGVIENSTLYICLTIGASAVFVVLALGSKMEDILTAISNKK